MAANDAWLLQGMNGAAPVESGETFTGLSRGFQVIDTATVSYSVRNPAGSAVAVAPVGNYTIGVKIDAPVVSLTVTGGTVLMFPESLDYTVA